MNRKKILFLDFDGVITNCDSRFKLNKDKLDLLGKIIDATDCCLVISSSWRKHTLEKTIEYLSDDTEFYMNGMKFPFCDRIIGVTERLYYEGEDGKFKTRIRGVEVKKWIDDNHFDGNYVILDDDIDFLKEQIPYFINTHPLDGIDEADVENAIKILNKE